MVIFSSVLVCKSFGLIRPPATNFLWEGEGLLMRNTSFIRS